MNQDTIVALATGSGGAISVIRVSGPGAIGIADRIFKARKGRPLSEAAGYTIHFGEIREPEELSSRGGVTGGTSDGVVVDEVLVGVFRAPHSYTGEDSVEISCHASPYIEGRILRLLIESGARSAEPGEFTLRAFLAGKLDLAQAEAVADLISSTDRAQHTLAMDQMKGGVSSALASLRGELVELAALLELELDFAEEDVAFADRGRLLELARRIDTELASLADSFSTGNAIKEGIPVAIVGRPNAGKSTLLNALVGEDRAMVSAIAGTTRDRIEERVQIGGVGFRFVDTAGLRSTEDELERMGIERTREAVRNARLVLLVVDAADSGDIASQISDLNLRGDQQLCVVVNKIDTSPELQFSILNSQLPPSAFLHRPAADSPAPVGELARPAVVLGSAKTGQNLPALIDWLSRQVDLSAVGSVVVSSVRHFEALSLARAGLTRLLSALSIETAVVPDSLLSPSAFRHQPSADLPAPVDELALARSVSTELLAEDVRETLFHLGSITGSVSTPEILSTIFSRFCIGK